MNKIYSNYVEISADKFYKNIKTIRSFIDCSTKLCIVMKSNAYGHGINNLIGKINLANPDYIGLVYNDEIANIYSRINNNKIKIIRLAPAIPLEVEDLIKNNIKVEEVIGTYNQAKFISELAIKYKTTCDIHLYVDTGMCRMGTLDIEHYIDDMLALPNINIVGIMSHFSKAHIETKHSYINTKTQFDIFNEKLKIIKSKIHTNLLIHISNSASTINFDFTKYDMVRVGDCLYGADVEELDKQKIFLQVFTSFKSYVAMIIDNIPIDTSIGYEGIYKTKRIKSTTATIRVGFDHGIPKDAYYKNIEVIINGKKYPIVGYVSMSMAIVDISTQESNNPIKIGDEVVIIGKQQNEEITLKEFAFKSQKSISEILLQIGNQCLHSTSID